MESTILMAASAFAASYMVSYRMRGTRKDRRGRRIGSRMRLRVRRTVESVYEEIGEVLFRRAYRMTYESFKELHRLLEAEIIGIQNEYQKEASAWSRRKRQRKSHRRPQTKSWKRYVPNGEISSTVRLAISLRFFAGGDLYDVAPLLEWDEVMPFVLFGL